MKILTLLKVLSLFSFSLLPPVVYAREPQIKVEQVLQTMKAWDGSRYTGYSTGQPQVTVLKITIPPNTILPWHQHPMISVAYVLSGHLTVEKRGTGERRVLHAGQALAETIQTTHRGFTTNEPVELVVFYAGQVGLPITINEEWRSETREWEQAKPIAEVMQNFGRGDLARMGVNREGRMGMMFLNQILYYVS